MKKPSDNSAVRKGSLAPDDRLQRDLWALALLLLAILLALSFVPVGESASDLLPARNIVGPVGRAISRGAWRVFGFAALVAPLLPAAWAASVLGRMGRAATIRWTALFAGVLVLIPTWLFIVLGSLATDVGAGWMGETLGIPLRTALGSVGAGILATFLLAALSVGTIGWNPLRSLARGGIRTLEGSRSAAGAVGEALGRYNNRSAPSEEVVDWGDNNFEWDADQTIGFEEDTRDIRVEDVRPPIPAPPPEPTPPARPSPVRRTREKAHSALADVGDPTSIDLPPTSLLTSPPPRDEVKNKRHLDGLGQVLIEKLATFKIQGEIVGTTSGPVVTQFEVSPAPGVKVARIANLEADLALAMRAPSIRIVAPIPGKGAVGVEVPNPEPEMVYFREILESPTFRSSKASLPLALGKDISGKPYVADLARMPHLLIAGATGSGKSVCINTIITSLVYRHSPQSLRMLMVDPKMVELSVYNELPHLRHPVVTDNSEAAGVLKWAVLEMEYRYALLSTNNVRNLADFNQRVDDGIMIRSPEPVAEEGSPERWVYKGGKLPFIVLIIDELADLMMTVQGEVERPLALLAQKARAIGIHLILATQRPSVNVITGLIKANFPSRIAFRVASKVDSRTILDQNGADALLGNGDLLLLPPGTSDPLRLQGAYLSTAETEGLMKWYRAKARERGLETSGAAARTERDIFDIVREKEGADDSPDTASESLEDRDRLFREAAELCIQHQGGSTSLLQRRLRIGYGRAARIIDQLHYAGVLGPADGSKPRELLIDFVQLDQLFPE